ncbi:MAG: ATP-binding cassette domain-containing protein, partial [Chloroflexi bacterium]|nr:ATP-binding cassette domain-containing protein [Chloroflexota bacterium]
MSAGTQTSAGLNRRQPPPLALDLQSLWVTYGDRTALRDVTAKVGWGLRVGVVGPNGSGKSTLLQTIVGLVTPRSGVIRVAGLPPKAARTQVAYVPQRERIRWDFPVSVLDVVVMGRYGRLGWLRRPGRADKEIALAALEQVNMTARAGTHISELSGGQQ